MDDEPWEPPEPRALALKLGLGALGLVALVGLLGYLLRVPITNASGWFVGRFGLIGVFVAVFSANVLPIGTHDPVLFAGHTGGLHFAPLASTAALASMLAAWFDFFVGRAIGARWAWLQGLVHRHRIPAFMKRYGAWAVAVAAVLPVPFALVSWSAGMSGAEFHHVVIGSVLRAMKILVTLTLITVGWHLTG